MKLTIETEEGIEMIVSDVVGYIVEQVTFFPSYSSNSFDHKMLITFEHKDGNFYKFHIKKVKCREE